MWSAIDWVLERLERHIGTIVDHGLMILFSMIIGFVFALWLAGYGR